MPYWKNDRPFIRTGKCSCGSFAMLGRSWSWFRDALTMVTELMGWYFNIGTGFPPGNCKMLINLTCTSVDEIWYATSSPRQTPPEEPLKNRRRMVRTLSVGSSSYISNIFQADTSPAIQPIIQCQSIAKIRATGIDWNPCPSRAAPVYPGRFHGSFSTVCIRIFLDFYHLSS
jgi:hypothetical protein